MWIVLSGWRFPSSSFLRVYALIPYIKDKGLKTLGFLEPRKACSIHHCVCVKEAWLVSQQQMSRNFPEVCGERDPGCLSLSHHCHLPTHMITCPVTVGSGFLGQHTKILQSTKMSFSNTPCLGHHTVLSSRTLHSASIHLLSSNPGVSVRIWYKHNMERKYEKGSGTNPPHYSSLGAGRQTQPMCKSSWAERQSVVPKEGLCVGQRWTLRLPRDRHVPGRKVDQGSRNPRRVAHWIEDGKCHQQEASHPGIRVLAAGLGIKGRGAWT